MDIERDPTDLGVSRALTVEEREELAAAEALRRREARRREETEPTGPPASGHVIARIRAEAGFSRSRTSSSLREHCRRCGASPRSWCRGRFGFVHAERERPAETPD